MEGHGFRTKNVDSPKNKKHNNSSFVMLKLFTLNPSPALLSRPWKRLLEKASDSVALGFRGSCGRPELDNYAYCCNINQDVKASGSHAHTSASLEQSCKFGTTVRGSVAPIFSI